MDKKMDQKLINLAQKAKENAYVPFSNFKVGAALLTNEGKTYTGCNIENASYGDTCCAERTAIFKAVSEGVRKIEKIAIVSSGGDFTAPCGICRQVMAEFMDDDGIIILSNDDGEIKEYRFDELLPLAFRAEDIK